MNEKQAIKQAKKREITAQRYLYEKYKMPLFSLCLRYSRDRSEAEDMLQEGFLKIFRDIPQYQGKGALLGWMKKIMINSALQYLRKWKKDWNHLNAEDFNESFQTEEVIFAKLGLEELTRLIQNLPSGYRIVFNLYVIEGYKHKEIAELLNISVNTSKSQLFKAKALLKKELEMQLLT